MNLVMTMNMDLKTRGMICLVDYRVLIGRQSFPKNFEHFVVHKLPLNSSHCFRSTYTPSNFLNLKSACCFVFLSSCLISPQVQSIYLVLVYKGTGLFA